MLLSIHVAAGGLALVLGAVALLVKKGGTIHRRSGLVFVYAMLVMGASASILGFLESRTDGNLFAGLMTAYFVGTALTTVRPVTPWTHRINVAALTVVVGLAVGDIKAGVEAFNNPGGFRNGVPYQMLDFIRHRHDPGGDWRRARHAIRHATRRAASGPSSLAHVLRPVHRGRIVLLDPRARGDHPSGTIHDGADARAADPAGVWGDVLLAMARPPAPVARARCPACSPAGSPTSQSAQSRLVRDCAASTFALRAPRSGRQAAASAGHPAVARAELTRERRRMKEHAWKAKRASNTEPLRSASNDTRSAT